MTYMASYITCINFGAVISEIVAQTGMEKSVLVSVVTGSTINFFFCKMPMKMGISTATIWLPRFIASIAEFLYSCDDDTLFVQQYTSSKTDFGNTHISQNTAYPAIDTKAGFMLLEPDFLLPSLKAVGYLPKASDALYALAGDEREKIDLRLIPYLKQKF